MKKRNFLLLLLLSSIFFFSCEKEVHINLNSGATQLVVDGQIETNSYPFVVLSKSIGYFSQVDLNTLQNNFVHNAIVTVSNGTQTVQLKEYTIDTGGTGSIKFYFYTVDSADINSLSFIGQPETFYTLKIISEGKTYTATAKIPAVKGVDSMWFKKPVDLKLADAFMMYVRYTDPDTIGNYMRYFTKRNNGLFLTAFNASFNDQIINGTTLDSLTLPAGYDKSKKPDMDSMGYYFLGDTITLKWCAMDKGNYDFFSTLEYATGSVGNPFSSPVNVTTNIKGGALGVWAAYGVQLTTKVVGK